MQNLENLSIEFWINSNLISLLQLLTSRSHGKEPLVNYSSSHVVTSNQYLAILTQKEVDKEILNKIKKFKTKEKEEKTWKQVQDTFT
jgi:hypothetical protein